METQNQILQTTTKITTNWIFDSLSILLVVSLSLFLLSIALYFLRQPGVLDMLAINPFTKIMDFAQEIAQRFKGTPTVTPENTQTPNTTENTASNNQTQ